MMINELTSIGAIISDLKMGVEIEIEKRIPPFVELEFLRIAIALDDIWRKKPPGYRNALDFHLYEAKMLLDSLYPTAKELISPTGTIETVVTELVAGLMWELSDLIDVLNMMLDTEPGGERFNLN